MAKIGHLSCVSSYKDTEDTNPTQKDSNHGQTMFQQPQYQEPSHWGLVLQQMNYGGITNIWPIAVVHSFFFLLLSTISCYELEHSLFINSPIDKYLVVSSFWLL